MRTLRKKIFSAWRGFLGRGCGGQGQNRWMVFFRLFPGFPFLRGHEVEESINTEGPPSFHPKRNFMRWVCGRRCGKVEGLRF
jgi:hypothetical protein